MLVRVQPGAGQGVRGLSSAENRVHDLLASWAAGTEFHIPGLTLLNVYLPDKGTTRQVDGLVFLPSRLAVVEVKGFTSPQSGQLVIPPNGAWRVGDEPAAIHTLAGAPTPGEQVRAGVFAAKDAFAEISGSAGGGNGHVRGLVVLVTSGRLTLPTGNERAGRGIDVALGTQNSLRRVMHRYRRQPQVWTADGVLAACREVGLAELAPSRDELHAEGFPEHVPEPEPAEARDTAPPAPPPPRPGPTTTARPSSPAPRSSPRTPAPPLATRLSRPRRRVPWMLILGLVLFVAIAVTAAILVNQLFHG